MYSTFFNGSAIQSQFFGGRNSRVEIWATKILWIVAYALSRECLIILSWLRDEALGQWMCQYGISSRDSGGAGFFCGAVLDLPCGFGQVTWSPQPLHNEYKDSPLQWGLSNLAILLRWLFRWTLAFHGTCGNTHCPSALHRILSFLLPGPRCILESTAWSAF